MSMLDRHMRMCDACVCVYMCNYTKIVRRRKKERYKNRQIDKANERGR